MFEIIMLTEENISELAKKLNRPEVDLIDEYISAREEGRVVLITVMGNKAWETTTDDAMDNLLAAADISLGEFKEIVRGDIQYVIDRRIEWLMGQISAEDVLPPCTGGTRKELMSLIDADRANDGFRATFLRSPMQWARRRDEVRQKLDSFERSHISEKAKQDREIRNIRGW